MSAASKSPHEAYDESRFVLPSSPPSPAVAALEAAPSRAGTGARVTGESIPARRPGRLLFGTAGRVRGTALLRQQAAGLAALGERLTALAHSQATLLHELRLTLDEGAGAVADEISPLAARIAAARDVLSWCDAVQQEIAVEAVRAAASEQPIDLLRLCHDVVHDHGLPDGAVAVSIHGLCSHPVWGNVQALAEAIRLGVWLAAQRGPGGAVHMALDGDGVVARVRICNASADHSEPDALAVEAFRAAVAAAGVAVEPDASGPEGAGMVLSIPAGPSPAA